MDWKKKYWGVFPLWILHTNDFWSVDFHTKRKVSKFLVYNFFIIFIRFDNHFQGGNDSGGVSGGFSFNQRRKKNTKIYGYSIKKSCVACALCILREHKIDCFELSYNHRKKFNEQIFVCICYSNQRFADSIPINVSISAEKYVNIFTIRFYVFL